MTPRRTLTGALALCAALTLVGCAKGEPPPTVMKTPTIIWQDGIEPSSPLESDERVIAARQGEIGRAMATNSGDFTIAQLTDHVAEEQITRLASHYGSDASVGLPPLIYPGPPPWQPLDITGNDTEATLTVCKPAMLGKLGEVFDEGESQYDRARTQRIEIDLVYEDGAWKIARYDGADGECDGSAIPIGLFDPAPKVPTSGPTEPVRPPLFWDDDQ